MAVLDKVKGNKNYALDSAYINKVYYSLKTGQTITAADKVELGTMLAAMLPKLGTGAVLDNATMLGYFGDDQNNVNKFMFCIIRQFSGSTQVFEFVHGPGAMSLKVVGDMEAIATLLVTLGVSTLTTGTITSSSVVLNWTAVDAATGYIVERATNAGFTAGLTTVYTGASLTATATGLTTATAYYFRVRATANGYTTGANSTTATATTS